jgi:hypothetical protein
MSRENVLEHIKAAVPRLRILVALKEEVPSQHFVIAFYTMPSFFPSINSWLNNAIPDSLPEIQVCRSWSYLIQSALVLDERPAVWNDDLSRLRQMVVNKKKHRRYKYLDPPNSEIMLSSEKREMVQSVSGLTDGGKGTLLQITRKNPPVITQSVDDAPMFPNPNTHQKEEERRSLWIHIIHFIPAVILCAGAYLFPKPLWVIDLVRQLFDSNLADHLPVSGTPFYYKWESLVNLGSSLVSRHEADMVIGLFLIFVFLIRKRGPQTPTCPDRVIYRVDLEPNRPTRKKV